MPPKKDNKKKKQDDAGAKYQDEIQSLEWAKTDMQVEESFLQDKFRQLKSENDRLKAEVDNYKSRLGNATEDYADILDHRQEQIKAEELKLRSLVAQIERLETDLSKSAEEVKSLKEQNGQQASRLNDAAALLQDKENLEDAVRKQHDLIEKQSDELRSLRRMMEERDSELGKARSQVEELALKSSAVTELKILFEEPWMVQTSHARLKGEVPLDREWGGLCALASGKLLVLYGGVSKTASPSHDAIGREVAILNMESMTWDRPGTARVLLPLHSHTMTVVGRTKLLVLGGSKSDMPCADVALLNTDNMKWMIPQVKGMERPPVRYGHSTCAIREKLFVFGGCTTDNVLLNDLWIFDQDSLTWSTVTTFGSHPTPRKGASLCATEDGRRLYLFGGFDGSRALNDVMVLELEKLSWAHVPVHVGGVPEPREDHVACIISKYMIVSGGCTQGGTKRLADLQVFDLYSPRWECLDEGTYATSLPWLRPHATYSCFYGNKQFTIKPNMHEKLWELQTVEFVLPEDIERLRHSKKRDLGLSERLELRDDAVVTVSSIEVSWRPPTKNAERINRYKLMVATGTGVVKDAYSGKETRFKILGLKPNTEYVLCVKAIYEDGSFLWSESKAFTTSA